VSTARLQEFVRTCGLAFGVTEKTAGRLRNAGATNAFVAFLLPPNGGRVGGQWESPTDRQAMTWIPSGSFLMGSPPDEAGRKADEPSHTVSIARGFWMNQTEVTNAAYRRFLRANLAWQKDQVPANYSDGHYLADWQGTAYPEGSANYPVVRVSWYAARAYCEWTGGRLPTEAEWEYGARAGTTTMFWWGDAFDPDRVNVSSSLAAVGDGRRKNPWGVVDILGNVWEWTSSRKADYPYNVEDGREDARADGPRIARGGGYSSGARFVRSAHRMAEARERCSDLIGFRCVR
jgi:formylglycine-generating enzyme required for sulfatase activity